MQGGRVCDNVQVARSGNLPVQDGEVMPIIIVEDGPLGKCHGATRSEIREYLPGFLEPYTDQETAKCIYCTRELAVRGAGT